MTEQQYQLLENLPLAAMSISVDLADQPVPDDVAAAWMDMVTNYRRQVDQSEASLVAVLLRQGATWADLAALMQVKGERAAQERYGDLVVGLRTHPVRQVDQD